METTARPGNGWNIALWLAQILLAFGFGFGGYGKMSWPIAEINVQVPWASAIPEWLMRFIGVAEVAGAIGLVIPALTRIRPVLTPLAAAGLAIVMVLAAGFHLFRAEYLLILANTIYGGLAVFVVWGRIRKSPVQAR